MAAIQSKKSLYTGPEGCGKTYLAKQLTRKCKRLAILDLNSQKSLGVGCQKVTTAKAFFAAIKKSGKTKAFKIYWDIPKNYDPREALNLAILAAQNFGGLSLLLDEGESYISNMTKLSSNEYLAARRSRHVRLDMHITSLFPMDLHRDFRRNCQHVYAFKSNQKDYKKFIRETFSTPEAGPKPVTAMNSLEKYGYLYQDPAGDWTVNKKY